jgi:hypothetical protein
MSSIAAFREFQSGARRKPDMPDDRTGDPIQLEHFVAGYPSFLTRQCSSVQARRHPNGIRRSVKARIAAKKAADRMSAASCLGVRRFGQ